MKQEHANELIEVLVEIVSALHREMGTNWCSSTIDKLYQIKNKIDVSKQLENE